MSEVVEAKNWWVRIEEARERGSFTNQDKVGASDWFSCACGNLDPRIKRQELGPSFSLPSRLAGCPLDTHLADNGTSFCWAVRNDDVNRALEVLNAIETREAELLAEIGEVE